MSDDIFEFLDGAAPYDGVWFDEAPPPGKGHYWWRTPLRAEVETLRGKALAYDLDRAEIQRLAAERQRARLPAELTAKLESAALIAERLDAQLIECHVLTRTDIDEIERLHFALRDVSEALEQGGGGE